MAKEWNQAAFKKAERAYKEWKKECEALVADWRWASDELFFLTPFEVERCGIKITPGKWLDKPLKNVQLKPKYGLDEQGRVMVMHLSIYPTPTRYHELFVRHGNKLVETVYFGAEVPKELIQMKRLYLAKGRPVSSELYKYDREHEVETYEYEGDRLVRVHCRITDDTGLKDEHLTKREDVFTYDGQGRLARIVATLAPGARYAPEGETWTVYPRERKRR